MKTGKLAVSFILIIWLTLITVAYVVALDKPAKPDREKPVHATDVRLVKKVSVRAHGGPPIKPPGKGKKETGAATGVLGVPFSGDRYAIVVGISDYPGTENDLQYCDDDADDMCDALVSNYGFANITPLIDSAATRGAILDAIDDIPSDAGEVVFFFSGHGAYGFADDGDKEKKDEAIVVWGNIGESFDVIWDGELKGAFSDVTASRIVFIFDTCMAGGMKSDLQGPGRVIAMAATENGLSYELPWLQNGEFTYYFAQEGMLDGNANTHDYDSDTLLKEREQVTVEEAWDYARANCRYDTPTIGDYFPDDLLLSHGTSKGAPPRLALSTVSTKWGWIKNH